VNNITIINKTANYKAIFDSGINLFLNKKQKYSKNLIIGASEIVLAQNLFEKIV